MAKTLRQAAARFVETDVSISRTNNNNGPPGIFPGGFCIYMEQHIPPHSLHQVIRASAEIGATAALIKSGKLKPYLKKSEAFKQYGRASVEHWLETGLLKPRKDGDHSAAWRLDRIELEIISKAILLTQII